MRNKHSLKESTESNEDKGPFAYVRDPQVLRFAWRFFRAKKIPEDMDRLIRYHWDHWIREQRPPFVRDMFAAQDLGVTRRTILRWKRWLVKHGFLRIETRFDEKARDRQKSSVMDYSPMVEQLRAFITELPARQPVKRKDRGKKKSDPYVTPGAIGASPGAPQNGSSGVTPLKIRRRSEDKNAISALVEEALRAPASSFGEDSPLLSGDSATRTGFVTLSMSSTLLAPEEKGMSKEEIEALILGAKTKSANIDKKEAAKQVNRRTEKRDAEVASAIFEVGAKKAEVNALLKLWRNEVRQHHSSAPQPKKFSPKEHGQARMLIERWGSDKAEELISFATSNWTALMSSMRGDRPSAPQLGFILATDTSMLAKMGAVERHNEIEKDYAAWAATERQGVFDSPPEELRVAYEQSRDEMKKIGLLKE